MHNCLTRAIRHVQADDLVHRNVAEFIDTPDGPGRGTAVEVTDLQQAAAVIAAAQAPPEIRLRPGLRDFRRPPALMHAYIVLCLLVCRHHRRPVIQTGASVMDGLFPTARYGVVLPSAKPMSWTGLESSRPS